MRVSTLDELEQIDPTQLGDDELHRLVVADFELESRLASIRAAHVAEWESRKVWADDGSRMGWARLARECALTANTAKAEVRRAKKLRHATATATAFAEGKLSTDQVNLLTKAFERDIEAVFARDEQILIDDVVRPLRLRDAARQLDYWKERAYEQVGKDRPFFNPDGRHWSAARSFQDTVVAKGRLDPLAGTEYLSELEALERLEYENDWAAARDEYGPDALPSQLPRTAAQRRADAQVQMARNSRACRQGRYRQPRPLLTIHAGLGALSRMCELADGTVVSPGQVFPLLGEADIERIVFGSPSEVIDVGVRERFFTGALRRAIEVRDRHCQHPSDCPIPAEDCEIDHKIRYTDGGLTVQDNGRCYCDWHNRQRESLAEQQREREHEREQRRDDQPGEPDERPPPNNTS